MQILFGQISQKISSKTKDVDGKRLWHSKRLSRNGPTRNSCCCFMRSNSGVHLFLPASSIGRIMPSARGCHYQNLSVLYSIATTQFPVVLSEHMLPLLNVKSFLYVQSMTVWTLGDHFSMFWIQFSFCWVRYVRRRCKNRWCHCCRLRLLISKDSRSKEA